MQTASPVLRFNHADGTDALVSLLTGNPQTLYGWVPSWVHPALLPFLLWGIFAALLTWLVLRSGRGVQWAFLAAAVFTGWAASGRPALFEAENLNTEQRIGCSVYPADPDPGERNYWLWERAPLLLMNHEYDRIILPAPPGEGDIVLSVALKGMSGHESVPGLVASSAGLSHPAVYIDSPVREAPGWGRRHFRREEIPRVPENLADTVVVLTLPDTCSFVSLGIEWSGGHAPPPAGLYLDRIGVGRE
jgi:hypothetical protein